MLKRILIVTVLATITALGLFWQHKSRVKLDHIGLGLESRISKTEILMDRFASGTPLKVIQERALQDTTFLKAESSELSLISQLEKEDLIALVFSHGQLRFWSSNLILLERPDTFPIGLSYYAFKNGTYLLNRIVTHGSNTLFLSRIKSQFDLENIYLTNEYTSRFSIPEYVNISKTHLSGSIPIHSDAGKTLFYIYLNTKNFERSTDISSVIEWVILLALFYLAIKIITFYLAEKGNSVACIFSGVFVPVAARFIMIRFHLPDDLYNLKLFSPLIYSSSSVFYSLGDFGLNLILVLWLAYMSLKLLPPEWKKLNSKLVQWLVVILCALVQCSLFYLFEKLFRGLVANSNIPVDLTNILGINHYSILAFSLLAISWLSLLLLSRLLNRILHLTEIPKTTIILFICSLTTIVACIQILEKEPFYFSLLCGLLSLLIYLRGPKRGKLQILPVLILVLLISFISALRLLSYGTQKENVNRLAFAEKLEKSSDPVSEFLLKDNEQLISKDITLSQLLHTRQEHLKPRLFRQANQHLQKFYFGRNFSNFELQSFLYDGQGELISGPDVYTLGVFLSAANSPNIRKVSEYFYQLQTSLPDYIGIIPIKNGGYSDGTLVIRITARYLGENNSFPELLMDKKTSFERRQELYSYAYYKNGSLLDKFGKYPYSITDHEITAGLKSNRISYKELGNYNHLIYTPFDGNVIVVSQPGTTFFKQVAVFSYVLAFNLAFFSICMIIINLSDLFSFADSPEKILEIIKRQRFLYKTRIRLSLISGVFFSLTIVGWVTLVYIANQYAGQQVDQVSTHINTLRKAFENEMPVDSLGHVNEKYNLQFLSLASRQASDLNFFDTNGDLQFTTLPKLFDRGLISSKMDPRAFYEMDVSGRTELINKENIGKLSFLSVYAPVRNSLNQVAGYINMPYFGNQSEIDLKLSNFVNALINVYVLVFLFIGILAFVLASSITNPLALIQESLRRINIGNVNLPLKWKRDDEIGDLIRAYNQMVLALEESAEKLAQSERETAWREMAKQVAHEIKNPLTPLKLGIQHLEQAWKNKDERFDEKFKKFSRTFVEQIDSLSAIASEFSNFAKMPQAQEELFDLLSLVIISADLFRESEYLDIELLADRHASFKVYADRDQMLRVLNNLLKNALQSIPNGKAGKARISIWKEGSEIFFEIRDNGAGIPDEAKSRIFMPNFTTKSSGMGLGLAFVKNVIESARGKVSFSTSKEGTAFLVSLPAA